MSSNSQSAKHLTRLWKFTGKLMNIENLMIV
jgi:hypothetical protein